MYSLTTNNVKISVVPSYSESQSMPHENLYAWAYHITIQNVGKKDTVQLISRHWIITDANGLTRQVKGPGVIGEQPILAPGQSFEYTSGVTLNTQSGIMSGTYQMVVHGKEGESFNVDIPAFSLDTPQQLVRPN